MTKSLKILFASVLLGCLAISNIGAQGSKIAPVRDVVSLEEGVPFPEYSNKEARGFSAATASPASAAGTNAVAPGNDEQAGAITISTVLPQTLTQDTTMATVNPIDPVHTCTGQADAVSVWYRFVSNYTGILVLDTFGSTFVIGGQLDTVLNAYPAGAVPSPSNQLACNDDTINAGAPTTNSRVRVAVTAGQTYLIEVTSFGSNPGGNLVLNASVGTNAAPTLGNPNPPTPALTPSSGTGVSQTFTFVFNDTDGVTDLNTANMLINSTFNGANACFLVYDRFLNTVSLVNDSSTGSSKVKIGSNQTAENSQCIFYGSGSTAVSTTDSMTNRGTDLTLTFPLAFKQNFAGTKSIFMYASDIAGAPTPNQTTAVGTWTVPAMVNQPPQANSIAPASGTGQTQGFTFVFSDGNGFTDLVTTQVIFNNTLDARNACTIIFDRFANAAFLLSDSGLELAKAKFGTAGSVENGQCRVDVSGGGFSGAGNNLTVSGVNVTFLDSFAGARNAYLYATDIAGLNSGLPIRGTWTVPAPVNQPPTFPFANAVIPASGTGTSQTFAVTFSDPNGYGDLTGSEMIINSVLDAKNSCTVVYDRPNNAILLLNDNATASTVVTLGTLASAQNSQCVIYGIGSTANSAGFNTTVNIAVAFKPAFAGAKNVYLYSTDKGGLNTGIQQKGTWTVPTFTNQAPSAVSVSPSAGSGQGQVFTETFSDPNGFGDLVLPEIIINNTLDGRNACLVLYDTLSKTMFLVNDSSTNSTKVRPGTLDTAENGQCTLSGSSSSAVGSGNTLTMTTNVTFKQSFAGTRTAFLYSQDTGGLNTGFASLGTWTVPGFTNQPPVAVSATPSAASGNSQVFKFLFNDPNGYGDLVNPEVIINATADARNGCVIIFDRPNGAVLLLNDAATASTSVLLDSSQTAQNSQCVLLGQGSLSLATGTDLTLQLNIQFKPAFNGVKNLFLYTTDILGTNSGFQNRGTYTVQ